MKKGTKMSVESRMKISSANKGKKRSEETKKKLSIVHKGKILSSEHKEKLRQAKIGKKQTEEHKKNSGAAMVGHIVTEETREKIRKALLGRKTGRSHWKGKKRPDIAGDKCHLWKGGITPVNKFIRTSSEYKLWREAVFARDNWACIWCGIKSGKGVVVELNADHIKPFSQYPELRFAIDNGRTLCRPCHLTTDTWGAKSKNK